MHGASPLTSRDVRWVAAIALAFAAASCGGGEQRVSQLRPPAPITLTAAVHKRSIEVSPSAVGAGQIVLIVSNQSGRPQKVTMETDELGGSRSGRRSSSPTIPASATGRLTIDARRGVYRVHVGDDSVRAARVVVGPARKSAQDDLLQP